MGFGSEILDTPLAQSFLSDGRDCENSPANNSFMHRVRAFDAYVTIMSQASSSRQMLTGEFMCIGSHVHSYSSFILLVKTHARDN